MVKFREFSSEIPFCQKLCMKIYWNVLGSLENNSYVIYSVSNRIFSSQTYKYGRKFPVFDRKLRKFNLSKTVKIIVNCKLPLPLFFYRAEEFVWCRFIFGKKRLKFGQKWQIQLFSKIPVNSCKRLHEAFHQFFCLCFVAWWWSIFPHFNTTLSLRLNLK